jgi:hypothetical protein
LKNVFCLENKKAQQNRLLAWAKERMVGEYFDVDPTRLRSPGEAGIQSRELSEDHVKKVMDSYTIGNVQTNILVGVTFYNRGVIPDQVDIDRVLDHGVYIISGDHRREALTRLRREQPDRVDFELIRIELMFVEEVPSTHNKLRLLGSLYNRLEHVQKDVTFKDKMMLIMKLVTSEFDKATVRVKANEYAEVWGMSQGAMTEMLMHARRTHLHPYYMRLFNGEHLKPLKKNATQGPPKVESFYAFRFIGVLSEQQQIDVLELMIKNKMEPSEVSDYVLKLTIRNIVTEHILKALGYETLKEGQRNFPQMFSAQYLNKVTELTERENAHLKKKIKPDNVIIPNQLTADIAQAKRAPQSLLMEVKSVCFCLY